MLLDASVTASANYPKKDKTSHLPFSSTWLLIFVFQ